MVRENRLFSYASTWGCAYCHSFNHTSRNTCFNCGAKKESADWIVDDSGYILPKEK